MNKPWKLVLLLIGIFIAGGVTGAFVMLKVGREMVAKRPQPEQWAPQHLKRIVDRLGLKPEEAEVIRPIVRRNMEDLNRLRASSFAETKVIFERMEREISAQLTPEQRAKFEQMNKEMRERAKKVINPRERPPGEPGKSPDEKPPGERPPPDKPPGN
jgi:uncharacterized membrane protein